MATNKSLLFVLMLVGLLALAQLSFSSSNSDDSLNNNNDNENGNDKDDEGNDGNDSTFDGSDSSFNGGNWTDWSFGGNNESMSGDHNGDHGGNNSTAHGSNSSSTTSTTGHGSTSTGSSTTTTPSSKTSTTTTSHGGSTTSGSSTTASHGGSSSTSSHGGSTTTTTTTSKASSSSATTATTRQTTTTTTTVATTTTEAVPNNTNKVVSWSTEQYLALAKCFFVIHGEFTYTQAAAACEARGAYLGFFFSPSEEHTVRQSIDWKNVPGFQKDQYWIGQLWLGIRRSSFGQYWVLDNPLFAGYPSPFTAFEKSIVDQGEAAFYAYRCLVIRERGWVPYNCSGMVNYSKRGVGALCSTIVRQPQNDTSSASSQNYCSAAQKMPASTNSVAVPLMAQKNYFLISGSFTFDEASKACVEQDAQLASARTDEDIEFIRQNVNFTTVDDNRAWMGLKRKSSSSSTFVWTDDNSINSYTRAFAQEDTNGECVSISIVDPDSGNNKNKQQPQAVWHKQDCSSEKMAAFCQTFVIF